MPADKPACDPALWLLDETITYLNHGSFGACPRAVLDFQAAIRERIERQPMQFFVRDLEPLLDDARHELARFLSATPENLVFVPNATAGVNTVLRSLEFEREDELLVTNYEYNASRNALDFVAARAGARVVVAKIPFPLQSPDQIVEAVMGAVTEKTRLALFDHVTSQTGVIFPVKRLVDLLSEHGIDALIDGAHAPGMLPLSLDALGAAYYTGNCHKWLCGPKTAAFLYIRPDLQPAVRPLIISHGANSPRSDRSKLQIEFGWTGTGDPSACLSVPEAIRSIAGLVPGGWPAVMRHNHELALAGRELLCKTLGIGRPCPDEMIGSLASIPLPATLATAEYKAPLYLDPLQDALLEKHQIEVPVIRWASSWRLLRISAQLYNSMPQYIRLASVLSEELFSQNAK
ncbi:MAG: cefD, isopenicillin-N epimerase [Chthoniobacteraceae bacterium]|nr:cefD, isopenicillin-N epimerase [Chthoniobacteraceae bacterium]